MNPDVCPFCNTEVSATHRPYVCKCGSSFGKRGWLQPVIVHAKRMETQEEKQREKIVAYRKIWCKIHSKQLGSLEFVEKTLSTLLNSCPCKKKSQNILKDHPPRYSSEEEWFLWTVEFHNLVNASIEKPTISIDRSRMLWRNQRPQTGRSRAIITVANGPEHVEILKLTRPHMQAYADRVDSDFIDLDNDTEIWGPMEKFRVWHFAQQYDEVLFVDADCVIQPDAPNIFEEYTEDICVHDDWGRLRDKDWLMSEINLVSLRSGVDISNNSRCLNSGVILSRRNACDIWRRPTVDIGTTHFAEQIWLGEQIEQSVRSGASLGILDAKWNWQWWYGKYSPEVFDAGLDDAYIIHFSNTPNKAEQIKKHLNGTLRKRSRVRQKRIDGLVAVTAMSLLPHHLSRQSRTIESWERMGLRVISGNSKEQIEELSDLYPTVEFVECGQSSSYDTRTSRIYDLMQISDQPFLLINSDIEIYGDQNILLDAIEKKECLIGLRHNYDTNLSDAIIEPWGIDAFLLYPEISKTFPSLDFGIGKSMWDYWIPLHLDSIGINTRWVGEPFFFHQSHPIFWKQESLETGRVMLQQQYGSKNCQDSWVAWRSKKPFGSAAQAFVKP